MKQKFSILVLLIGLVSPLSHWTTIGNGQSAFFIESFTKAGPSQEYCIQGQRNKFFTYSIDLTTGAVNLLKTSRLGRLPYLSDRIGRIQADGAYNVVLASRAVFRFNIKPGEPEGLERYPVPTGKEFSYPYSLSGTSFIFVGTKRELNASKKKIYRLFSDRVSGVEAFNTGANSQAYGVIFGTGWLLTSLEGGDERRLYDYTNGFEGGTNSSIKTHRKAEVGVERGFVSPEDGRGYYVIGGVASNTLSTVKDIDGSLKVRRQLSSLNGELTYFKWIFDTDLCVVGSWGNNFALVNFMDDQSPSSAVEVYYGIQDGWFRVFQTAVWKGYKMVGIPSGAGDKTYVYKALEEMPCSGLCATCDGIFRGKCLTCLAGSSMVVGGGASSQCLTCRPLSQFFEGSSCRSCATETSPICPQSLSLEGPESIQGPILNFSLKIAPSLKSSLPASFDYSTKHLTQKHLSFHLKLSNGTEILTQPL